MPKQGGDLDFKTLNKVDYLKNVYGRPVINKIDDSNIFNIDHSVPSGKPNKDPSAGRSLSKCQFKVKKGKP